MANMIVPIDMLQQLKCNACKHHLSVFPVYVSDEGNNPLPICGRCNIPNEDKFIRDVAYESLAQFLIFPCAHAGNGCKQELVPSKLKNHEVCCVFRKQDCPNKAYTKCTWKGSNNDLKKHFEECHATLLVKDEKFPIDFTDSIRENMLMSFQDNLFLVKKEINSVEGKFSCWIRHLIQVEEPKMYNYSVRVEAVDQTYYHTCPGKSTNYKDVTTLECDFVQEVLNNPSSVVAHIQLTEVKAGTKLMAMKKNANIDWNLLENLECPICTDYMHAPIYQCIKGHSICSNCKPKLKMCGICKSKINDTQNFTLEKLTDLLIYPCKYYNEGCETSLKSACILEHQSTCKYGPYKCPLKEINNCQLEFREKDIQKHIETEHGQFLLKSELVNVPFEGENKSLSETYIIIFANKLFKLCFKYENSKFYWAFQLIESSDECDRYKVEIDIVDHSGNKLRQYTRGPCVRYTENKDAFTKKGTYIIFLYDQIASFIIKNLSYRIRVIKE